VNNTFFILRCYAETLSNPKNKNSFSYSSLKKLTFHEKSRNLVDQENGEDGGVLEERRVSPSPPSPSS
jgi:hypothetical protein